MKWHFQRESSYVSSNLLLLSIQLKKPRSPGACQLLAPPSAPTTMLSISRMAQGRLGLSTNQGQHHCSGTWCHSLHAPNLTQGLKLGEDHQLLTCSDENSCHCNLGKTWVSKLCTALVCEQLSRSCPLGGRQLLSTETQMAKSKWKTWSGP